MMAPGWRPTDRRDRRLAFHGQAAQIRLRLSDDGRSVVVVRNGVQQPARLTDVWKLLDIGLQQTCERQRKRSEAGWVSSRDRFPGRVVMRRSVAGLGPSLV